MAYKQNSALSGSVNSQQPAGGKEVIKPAQISNIGMLNNQLGTFQANNPDEIAMMNQNLSKNHEIRVKKIYHINKPTAEPIFKPPAIKEESKSGSASGSGSISGSDYDSDYSSTYGSYDSDYSDSRSSGSYVRRNGDEDDDGLPPIGHHCDICERNARRKALQDFHESHSRMSNHQNHNHQHMHPPPMMHPPPYFYPPFPFHHPLPPLHPHAMSANPMHHLPLPPPSHQSKNNSFYQGPPPPPPMRADSPPQFQTVNGTNAVPPQRRFNWGDASKQSSSYLYGSYLRRSDVDLYRSVSRKDKPNASYKDLFHQRNNLVDYTYQQFHPKANQHKKPKQKQKLLKIFKEQP